MTDSPSQSEVYGDFETLGARLDFMDTQIAAGGGSIPPYITGQLFEWEYTEDDFDSLQFNAKADDSFISVENNVWTMHEGIYRVAHIWGDWGISWTGTTDTYSSFALMIDDGTSLAWQNIYAGEDGPFDNSGVVQPTNGLVFSTQEGDEVEWALYQSGGIDTQATSVSAGGLLTITKLLGPFEEEAPP